MKDVKVKVLVVEDEEPIRRFITLNLSAAGYLVGDVASGEEALEMLKSFVPKIVVLDLMLPGISGLEVCQKIRETMQETFVIMLTAKGQDTDKILGLELGADDYMVKPFNPLELIARVKAVLRRGNGCKDLKEVYSCRDLCLNVTANKLFKSDQEIDLTPIEFALIQVFMKNPGRALKREEMLNTVWGDDYFGDTKTLDVHIRRLREKIEDNPSQPEYIKTVWGSGYRWQQEP
ncbi:response regulator transcription factor [Desulfosporosinus sp.]|uniref:response regulator transcription factor n=1 Tax=Desulfosporosinus sp. TaxID=157907 RepID=UPI00231E2CC6|nr:response regulator transcription factor [Desulfosporosinus sp.]MCO5385007.1 response regulator transcription factor [Desulfosporosinus sp.]MDA8222359.1 response regulator transcription factor [Desulfitobacterium hafniense]